MTPQERDIIGRFIARVGGATPAIGSSVPATTQAPLPPIDPEADRFIADQFAAVPAARYRVTQMAFVQEAALAEAQNRIKQLEYQLQQAQVQAQQAPPPGQSRGLFGGLFGGGQQSAPRYAPMPQYAPPPQASYPPGYQQGMFGGGGSGFLGSALTTAAGVAGGVLAADAITSMFSGHGGGYGGGFGGGGFGGGGFGGGGWGGPGEVVNETVVNNYGPEGGGGGGGDPWGGSGTTDAAMGGGDAWSDGGGGGAQDDAWSGSGSDAGGGGDSGGGWDSGGGSDDSSF
jgi:hypothetical protein